MSVLQLVTNFTLKCLRCRKVSDGSAPFPASSDAAALPSLLQPPAVQDASCTAEGTEKLLPQLCSLGGHQLVVKCLLTKLLPCPAESHRDSPEEGGTEAEDQHLVLPYVAAACRGPGTTNSHPHPPSGTGRKQHSRSKPSHMR